MKKWQCQVCGYIHTGDEPPENCPVCGVDGSQFVLLPGEGDETAADVADAQDAKSEAIPGATHKCAVCGYVHKEEQAPEKCPVCGADGDQFSTTLASEDGADASAASADSKWQCLVCGFIHTGPEPPDVCPVCGADRSQFVLLAPEAPQPEAVPAGADTPLESDLAEKEALAPDTEPEPSRFQRYYATITVLMSRHHAHPISVHIPNGVLPVAVFFLLVGMLFGCEGLLQAGFYNLAFVFIAMPMVLFSGYNDWQLRFGGNMTRVFQIKITCGCLVAVLSMVLVVWWLINPNILNPWSGGRWLFILILALALAAAVTAGYYGGKLIKFPGEKRLSG